MRTRLRCAAGRAARQGTEKRLAVTAAEHKDEPLQVAAKALGAVGGIADELCQRYGQATVVASEPSRTDGTLLMGVFEH